MNQEREYQALFLGAGPQMQCGVGQFTRQLFETIEKIEARGAWNAIQQKHHVDLDFNGHAHHYESTYPIVGDGGIVDAGGIRYITSGGAGAAFDSPTPTPNPWTLVYYAGLSFGIVDVNGPTLTLQGYRVDGTTLEPAPIVLTK